MNISVTTLFDVGDKVWVKNSLDQFLSVEDTMRPYIHFYIPYMLFEVKNIRVKASAISGEEEVILYDLQPAVAPSSQYTATQYVSQTDNIHHREDLLL